MERTTTGLSRRRFLVAGTAYGLGMGVGIGAAHRAWADPTIVTGLSDPGAPAPLPTPILWRSFRSTPAGERIDGWRWPGGSLLREAEHWKLQLDGAMTEWLTQEDLSLGAMARITCRCPAEVWPELERDWLLPGADRYG